MIDLSEEEVDFNIQTTKKYLQRAAPMKQWLEMEIGITGGEEDGVNNEDVDNNSLYTQPEDIYEIFKTLSEVSPFFSIAAGFGNVHGVYKPGNVKLQPGLLSKHQKYVQEKIGSKDDKPVFLVFHGGSGSSVAEFQEAISYGVCKVNLDTDLQYAYTEGIRDYMIGKKEYVNSQVGNPDGADKPNKKVSYCNSQSSQALVDENSVLRPPCLGSRRREDHVQACRCRPQGLQHCQPALNHSINILMMIYEERHTLPIGT